MATKDWKKIADDYDGVIYSNDSNDYLTIVPAYVSKEKKVYLAVNYRKGTDRNQVNNFLGKALNRKSAEKIAKDYMKSH